MGKIPFLATALQFAFLPSSKGRLLWDAFVLLLVGISSIYTPYETAFKLDETDGADYLHYGIALETSIDSDRSQISFENLIDVFFFVDIVLTFWTGFDKGFEVITDKGQIVKKYLGGWFVVDLVATVPWDIVLEEVTTHGRMLRIVKVLRLARAGRIIKRLTMGLTVHTKFIDAINFFVVVLVVCHLLGCMFYVWPAVMDCEPDEPQNRTADAAFGEPDHSAHGWHFCKQCMQGSWRQEYGLEAVLQNLTEYQLRVCQETLEEDHPPVVSYPIDAVRLCGNGTCVGSRPWKAREFTQGGASLVATGTSDSLPLGASYGQHFVPARCQLVMTPFRRYTDSLYWSLTTMTTIGYGDRGPQTNDEIWFCMFAEIFGLAFFAILLTQINTVNNVLGETGKALNAQKDGVVQFLKHHQLDEQLIKETIKFMNFRSTALSGHAFTDDDPRFSMLSQGIRAKIRIGMNRPVLAKARIFGWNPTDFEEEESVHAFFHTIDTSGEGVLDRGELSALFAQLNLNLSASQFDQCFNELDHSGDGEVSYLEFKHWWYMYRNGESYIRTPPHKIHTVYSTTYMTYLTGRSESHHKQFSIKKSVNIVLYSVGILRQCY